MIVISDSFSTLIIFLVLRCHRVVLYVIHTHAMLCYNMLCYAIPMTYAMPMLPHAICPSVLKVTANLLQFHLFDQ